MRVTGLTWDAPLGWRDFRFSSDRPEHTIPMQPTERRSGTPLDASRR